MEKSIIQDTERFIIQIEDIHTGTTTTATTTTSVAEGVLEMLKANDLRPKEYNVFPTHPLFNTIKRDSIYSCTNRKTPDLKGKLKTEQYLNGVREIVYKSPTHRFTITIDNFKPFGKKGNVNFRKTLNYLLIKANEQNYSNSIYFALEDYQQNINYKDSGTAYKALKKYRDELMKISISNTSYAYSQKKIKEDASSKFSIFMGGRISFNMCVIVVNSEFLKTLCMYYTVLPIWANKLSVKAYDTVDYIYTQARQEDNQKKMSESGSFNISFKALNAYIGGYNPEETTKHSEKIINPILESIEEIENARSQDEIMVTAHYDYNYKNGYDFLEGYIEIKLDHKIIEHAKQSCSDRQKTKIKNEEIKKLRKANKNLKDEAKKAKAD